MMNETTTGPPGVSKLMDHSSRITKHLTDVLIEIQTFTDDLRKLRKAFTDDPSDATDAIKKLREITKLIGSLREYGEKAHEFAYERAGAAGEYAVNLDDARVEIGKRLDRIRLSRGADSVS